MLRKDTYIALTDFTTRQFKILQYDDIAFSLLLDPENGSIDKEIFVNGRWEEDMLAVMRTYIAADSVCLDVGANIGHHTLFMASLARDGVTHAFEPLAKLCLQIGESIAKNEFQNVRVHQYGLSDISTTHNMQTNLLNIGKTTLDNRYQGGSVEEVTIRRFDDIWDPVSAVSFVKIDVEGHEYKALLGMEQMLRKDSPVLLFEYSPIFYKENGTDCHELLNFVFSLGYCIFDCSDNGKKVDIDTLDIFIKICTFQTNLLCVPAHLYAKKT